MSTDQSNTVKAVRCVEGDPFIALPIRTRKTPHSLKSVGDDQAPQMREELISVTRSH
ncbi:hypothetical protein [Microbacterium sp. NPDC056052]|uniref:hypothetical protein n=1 Tax=Microbacterium sp. NPDC056052 TaxID=3345695 RepID=UPI0035D80608